ncbi:hypothetical protein CsSME_00018623 [Camellia sinensis var. sinensis]|uniref:DUF599 domain-containing protein n=1 Tax=Camellia sinensis var. sinensis TaxID=542762 RepID=A0A4S4EVX6_CAMSN|nr:uncharacterized protein LOC114259615 [Camellia sinensis]THG20792.1 hypothetical protein TEA_003866 [Camellia sinensis var. sinensis]
MGWTWKKEHLDVILVPSGLLIMFGYHLYLLYRYLKLPHTTAMGHENNSRAAWVERTMQIDVRDRGQALTVITTNISTATTLSSISLVLSSLIGTWLGTSTKTIFTTHLIYGDTSQSIMSIKHITLLIFFLIAFASFIQTTRCFVHATFLLTMPDAEVPASYVEKAVIMGSNFWSTGMRALYFAVTLLLWVFGPIPMFVSSVVMVGVLHNLDSDSAPLHQFRPVPSRSVLKNVGEEMVAVGRAVQQLGRPHGN